MPLITLAWTRATVEDAAGAIIATVERSTLDPDAWHITWMVNDDTSHGDGRRRRRMGQTETFPSWDLVRAALGRGLSSPLGATVTHDYLRRENGAGGVAR